MHGQQNMKFNSFQFQFHAGSRAQVAIIMPAQWWWYDDDDDYVTVVMTVIKNLARTANVLFHCYQPYLSLSFFTLFGHSYLHRTENISPPSLVASHRFLITATFRHSHMNLALRFVWRARPIPSRTTRSTPCDDIAFARSRFNRLKLKKVI